MNNERTKKEQIRDIIRVSIGFGIIIFIVILIVIATAEELYSNVWDFMALSVAWVIVSSIGYLFLALILHIYYKKKNKNDHFFEEDKELQDIDDLAEEPTTDPPEEEKEI